MIDGLARLGAVDGDSIAALGVGQAGQALHQGRLDRFGLVGRDDPLLLSPLEVQVDPAQPDRIGPGVAPSRPAGAGRRRLRPV